MFDLSFVEILFIAVLAVLIIGPKEFPIVLRQISKGIAHFKSLSHDIRSGISELADEAGITEVKHELEKETKYIIDQNGEYQEVYDISEFLDDEAQNKPKVTVVEPRNEQS